MKLKKKTKSPSFEMPIFDLTGEKKGQIQLNPAVFGIKPNINLVAQAVKVFLSRQRNAHPKTKTRGEVAGSGAKIWPQKGTGRARHKDRQAPIFVGGGVTHGPRGNRNWKRKISKKMKRLAFFSVLSDRFYRQKMMVVDDLKKLPLKTKKAREILEKLLSKTDFLKESKKICLLIAGVSSDQLRGIKNLKKLKDKRQFSLIQAPQANIYQLVNQDFYLLDPKAVEYFNSLVKKNNGQKD